MPGDKLESPRVLLNGGYPQHRMYMITPSDQISHEMSYLSLFRISGGA
jgi:hypothetical protein